MLPQKTPGRRSDLCPDNNTFLHLCVYRRLFIADFLECRRQYRFRLFLSLVFEKASNKIVLSNSSGLVNNDITRPCSRPAFLHRVRNIMCNRQPARKAIKRMTHASRQTLRCQYFGRDMVHKVFDNHTFFWSGFIVTSYRHFLSLPSFLSSDSDNTILSSSRDSVMTGSF